MLKKVLLGLGGVVVFLLAGVIIFGPMVLGTDWVKAEAEKSATEALGRAVTIEGTPKVSLLPPKLSLDGLTIANAEGFGAPYFAQMSDADISVKLGPLFRGAVEIKSFTLNEPEINLEAKPNGDVNWLLGSQTAEAGRKDNANAASGDLPISDLSLGDTRIVNGRIVFDNGTGTPYIAEDADLAISLDRLSSPLRINGTATVQGEASRVAATLSTPRSFLETEAADLTLNMTIGQNSVETTLALAEGLTFVGRLNVDVPALRRLIALTGATIDTPQGFNKLRLEGPVSGNTEGLKFGEGTKFSFDAIDGQGALTIALAGDRPKVSGSVSVPTLDLTPYLPETAAESGGSGPSSGTGGSFPEWSTEVMDFSALREVDADLRFNAGRIALPDLSVGESAVRVVLTNGRAVATVDRMQLYGGTGAGEFILNARGNTPSARADFTLETVDVGKLAADAAGMSKLVGTGNLDFDVTVTGATQQAWMESIDGKVDVELADGKLQGINIGKIARGAMSAYTSLQEGGVNPASLAQTVQQLANASTAPAEATDFTSLLTTAGIQNGVVSTQTIRLSGPYFQISGDATVNLPGQSMEMRLTPVVSVSDEDGAQRRLPVPILISGTFNSPSVGLDVQPLIASAAQQQLGLALGNAGLETSPGATIEETLRNTARDELRRRLRGDDDTPTDPDADKEPPSVEDVLIEEGLNTLFGRPRLRTDDDEEDPQ